MAQPLPSALIRQSKTQQQLAKDAADLAAWNSKKCLPAWPGLRTKASKGYSVWVPDENHGYVAGWVIKEEGEISTVALESGEEMRQVDSTLLSRLNPPNFEGAEDIADLTFLNEASVVHNLRMRYERGEIYTYSGLFLVAVNPYRNLPIYTQQVIEGASRISPQALRCARPLLRDLPHLVTTAYKGRRRDQNAPHVYAVAEKAWQNMLTQRDTSQSVLVTYDLFSATARLPSIDLISHHPIQTAASQTENTKKVIQYLAAIAADPLPSSASFDLLARQAQADATLSSAAKGKRLGQLERQILEANPILEAFGNAQTVKNNNSSRFGKFVRIFFNSLGAIAGANIDWYLLEKSRVTARSADERSYHVFFQLLRSGDRDLLEKLLLDDEAGKNGSRAFEYLAHSRQDVDGMDDQEEFKGLVRALNTVGFSSDEQLSLFRVVATILHLGQLSLSVAGSSSAHLISRTSLEKAAFLLGVSPDDLHNALLRPKVKAGREYVTQARTKEQVVDEIAALSKTIYEKNFGKLVDRINKSLSGVGLGGAGGASRKNAFIGVLDIAGFEIFETNGFEQLLINLTNEKLQQFFNTHMFELEQEEYAREKIDWEFIDFGRELQPTIDLIEGTQPMGVLSCLDDASIMPKSTDESFTSTLHRLASEKPPAPQFSKYSASRLQRGFTISHYAGNVEYRTDGWLDRNRDPLNDNITSLLSQSYDSHVASLFAEYVEDAGAAAGPRARGRKGAFRTLAQTHKEQLSVLLQQLHDTQPHFVRCIVPNLHKSPSSIDVRLVLDQLRCNGVLEGIRIARLGYPNRLPFSEFRRRFELLAPPGTIQKGYVDGSEACSTILSNLELDAKSYRLGLTKVFFKAGILAELEERRDEYLSAIFTKVQAACRKYVGRRQAKKVLHRAGAVRTLQRNARIYVQLRDWPWWPLFQRVRPLLAAARSDDELRRKEEELAAAKLRAEQEEQERARLQQLQEELERSQADMQRELAAERALGAEKEALLRRSKEREAVLQEALTAAELDVETTDRQLDRAMEAKKEVEQRLTGLNDAYANQNKLVETLQQAQVAWKAKEAELATQTSVQTAEWDTMVEERERNAALVVDLKLQLSEQNQDRRREQDRLNAAVSALEARLATETQSSSKARQKWVTLEAEARSAKEEVAKLQRAQKDSEGQVTFREAELARLRSDLTAAQQQQQAASDRARQAETQLSALEKDLADSKKALEASRSAELKAGADLLILKKLVDDHASDQQRIAELAKIRETEVQDLRYQVSKTASELSLAQRESARQLERSQADLGAARKEANDLRAQNSTLDRKASAHVATIARLEALNDELDRAQQAHDLELELLRTKTAEQMLQEREKWEKQLHETRSQFQILEDAAVQAKREKDAALRDVAGYKALLEAEQETVRARVADKAKLEAQVEQQHVVLADLDKINGDLRAELASTKARLVVAEEKAGRTVVEHIRVLEEAQRSVLAIHYLAVPMLTPALARRLQNLEMERIRADRETRDAYMQHEREAERRAAFANKAPKDPNLDRLAEELASEKRVRELAEVNVNHLRSEVQHLQSSLDRYKSEVVDLKRRNAQMERDLSYVAASDHTESIAPSSKSYAAFPTSKEPLVHPQPPPRRMQESRVGNALPSESRPRTISTDGPYGAGYGGVHASRTSVDFKRSSLQFGPPPPGPNSPRRKYYE
ncbi:SPOSA6832_00768, partial [Sporobolomyces salmonicolor]